MSNKFALGIVANPYPTVGVVYLDDDGQVRRERRIAGPYKFNSRGEAIGNRKNTYLAATIYNPHQPGGCDEVRYATILDATPRSWEEATTIALACEPGNHLRHRDEEELRGILATAIQTVLA